MPTDHRAKLSTIKRFDQLIAYLRDEMGWPIAQDSFEEVDDLFYDFTADELGIDPKTAAKIQQIKRLRPLSPRQPWGIFFVKFEPKKLPVVALRRILSQVALKKRASANSAERAAWAADDLLFVSNYGEGDERQISFAHFSRAQDGRDLPTLKVLGWDNLDTALHLDAVARELSEHLSWPDDDRDAEAWRTRWRAAFTLGHREVVTTSKELSIRLAELARNIRDRIKAALAIETDKGPLTRLMKAFQEALVHDLDADGFADMYAQTIAYGLLSARIADPRKKTADDFAAHMRTNPFLRELMETFLKVGGRRGKAGGPGIDFDELGVSEVVELLDDANIEAVVRDFGDRNPQEDPVIHFYELFLKEYDAKRRMQRGVFYTPRPVVSYIVRSVDELLRTEFGLADGLADTVTWSEMARRHQDLKIPEGVSPDQDFVQILDPATGTGTFLVEVIDLIHKTLVAKWRAQGHGETKSYALWNEYVPKHLLTRLHGYELLMAPYAIAHLKIGLKLYETGYRFGSDERARLYLTNALEPASGEDKQVAFKELIPALAHEAQAVDAIKRHQRFTVVIGNPPYSGFSSNMNPWIDGLLHGLLPGAQRTHSYYEIEGQSLGERKLWLQDDYVKFSRLSQRCLEQSGAGVHGMITNHAFLDSPTCRGMRHALAASFPLIYALDLHGSTKRQERAPDGSRDENVFDILPGVCIAILANRPGDERRRKVEALDLWGSRDSKATWLSNHSVLSTTWKPLIPQPPYFLLATRDLSAGNEYDAAMPLTDAMPFFATGIQTSRDDFAVALDRRTLVERMERFFDLKTSDQLTFEELDLKDLSFWKPSQIRREKLLPEVLESVQQVVFRAFDKRWIALHEAIVHRPRSEAMRCLGRRRKGLVVSRQQSTVGFRHVLVVDSPADMFSISNKSREGQSVFPLFVEDQRTLFARGNSPQWIPNLSDRFLRALRHLGEDPEDVLNLIYAQWHSPTYRERFAEFLKMDFPRIFIPRSVELFRALSRIGGELTALHLLESPKLSQLITEFMGGRDPEVEKISWAKGTVWIDKAQTTGFKGVREDVWNFHIGGYQVCDKWLKDRKGRRLSKDDITHYQKIVVALSETIRLMKEIDEVIEKHGGWPGAFQAGEAKAVASNVSPFRPRPVEPKVEERYVTCVPLVPLRAAGGAFGDPQHMEDESFEWVAVESRHRLRPGMFVAQVVGKSMEPAIPDGAYCLFRAPVEGSRQGKTVLVQLRDVADPESGERYTVKRYESQRALAGDSWRHEKITLKPNNPDCQPIELASQDAGELSVIAEFLEVIGPLPQAPSAPATESEEGEGGFTLTAPAHSSASLLIPDAPEAGDDESAPADADGPGESDPEELPWRVRQLFSDGATRDRETAIRDLRAALGFGRTGHVIREQLDSALRTAVRRGILRNERDALSLDVASIDLYERSFLKEQFLASLGGRVWRERDDAIRTFARWLGFRRIGPIIDEKTRSIINGLIREQRLETRASEIRRAD